MESWLWRTEPYFYYRPPPRPCRRHLQGQFCDEQQQPSLRTRQLHPGQAVDADLQWRVRPQP